MPPSDPAATAAVVDARSASVYFDVVVVGAGVAGLQAAQTLLLRDQKLRERQQKQKGVAPHQGHSRTSCAHNWCSEAAGCDGANAPSAPLPSQSRSACVRCCNARQRPLSVLVVEASARVGGRVKSVEGLAAGPVELGPEFVHGRHNNSVASLLVDQMRLPHRELPFPDRYFFGDEGRLLPPDEVDEDADVAAVHSFFAGLRDMNADETDESSVAELMRLKGCTARQIALAESIYSNDFGCSLRELGVRESVREAKSWVYGDSYLLMENTLSSSLVAHLTQGLEIWRDWPVRTIAYSPHSPTQHELAASPTPTAAMEAAMCCGSTSHRRANGCLSSKTAKQCCCGIIRAADRSCCCHGCDCHCCGQMHNSSGRRRLRVVVCKADGSASVAAHSVIVTVPITILQSGDIEFSPPLPPSKTRAIARIRMANAVKVVLTFSERFWPEDVFDVVCTESFIPEVWMTAHKSKQGSECESKLEQQTSCVRRSRWTIVGFAAGHRADEISALPRAEALAKALAQLDRMFGQTAKCGASGSGQPQPNVPTSAETLERRRNIITPSLEGSEIHFDFHSAPEDSCRQFSAESYPATHAFVGGFVADWSREPFTRGAYTHPSIGALVARDALAKPIQNVVFFAGEATHHGVNPCLQGAMDTGTRAGNEVFWEMFGSSKL